MRIKTEKDVQKLDAKLKSIFGVDVSKYRNPEIAEKFVDLIVFPQFALNWVLRPIAISFFIYIILFYLLNLSSIMTIVYGIFGLILFLLNGILFGMLLVLWKMKKDMFGVMKYSLNIMKECIVDLKHVSTITKKENKKETLGLLFLGITHIVTIPMVTQALGNKIPFLGGLFSKLFMKILRLASSRIKFNYDPNKNEIVEDKSPAVVTNTYTKSIDNAIEGLDKFLTTILRVGQFPISMVTLVTFSLLGILLYAVI
tara:strand:+ start:40 stop:807 length:768 start_codon:yes stop_codon:yes gene_type:complete